MREKGTYKKKTLHMTERIGTRRSLVHEIKENPKRFLQKNQKPKDVELILCRFIYTDTKTQKKNYKYEETRRF